MAKYKANFIFWVTENGFLRLAREAQAFFSRITGAKFDFKITLDLFCEKKIADNSGFKVGLRMVAHCGYFSFWLDEGGKKIDFAGSCGIKVFRLEKEAHEEELIVTSHLFEGLQPILKDFHIEAIKEHITMPLKGFSVTDVHVYRLIPPKKGEEKSSDLLKLRLTELNNKTQKIRVLAGVYDPIDIEKNFINLTIKSEKGSSSRGFLKTRPKIKAWKVEDYLEEPKEEKQEDKLTAEGIFQRFNKGFIYGLPGAGKTTILHYFVHSTFKIAKELIIYVECKHLPDFEIWCNEKQYKLEQARYDAPIGLKYLLFAFLFAGKSPGALSPDELVSLMEAEKEVVKKVAGTPLTGLLLMVYYEIFRRIDSRYTMYDILLKFFLLRIWDSMKKGYRLSALKEFFNKAKGDSLPPDILAQKALPKIEWVYKQLADTILSERKQVLEEGLKGYQGLSKLSRPTLLRYIPADEFFGALSEIEDARISFFKNIISEKQVDDWAEEWHIKKWGIQNRFLLNLDTPEYYPEDKNFKYYQDSVGHRLKGFLGSPNLKHENVVNSCAFSSDGRQILSGSADRTLLLWDTETANVIREFKGHTNSVLSCVFSPDGRQILSGSADRTLKLWDTETGEELQSINLLWTPHHISINPKNGNEFITANLNGTLTLFDFSG